MKAAWQADIGTVRGNRDYDDAVISYGGVRVKKSKAGKVRKVAKPLSVKPRKPAPMNGQAWSRTEEDQDWRLFTTLMAVPDATVMERSGDPPCGFDTWPKFVACAYGEAARIASGPSETPSAAMNDWLITRLK